ncbi:MAG: 50S ribosomal protein L23 [Nitrososphaeraceae archaeon]|jgi:large subunit ribosomal protein L23|nr:50S ribosomal protein L23 [Nitrososphaeraceae archaeon]MDW0331377.1 50S ribosomal protein L23 [Nitrososphaeraceae archaeon]
MKGKKKNKSEISIEKANTLFIQPYVTEKTFNIIEKENKLTFIVSEKSTKREIIDAMRLVYEADASEVNIAKTIQGKKAIIKFKSEGGARELATRLGLV